MHPVFIVFGIKIFAYTLFTTIAFCVVVLGGYFYSTYQGMSRKDAFLMVFVMGLSAFLGARIFNFIVNFPYYQGNYFRLLEISTRGFSLYGGLIGAIISGLIVSKIRKINLMRFADLMTPFVGLGIVFMRIGCFLNGCCFGKETNSVFGVIFPELSPAHVHQLNTHLFGLSEVLPVHPTQLYELFFVALCVIFAFWGLGKNWKNGTVFLICGILFSVFRWINMGFRELDYPWIMRTVFYPGFYLGVILLCLFLLVRIYRLKK